MLVLCFSMQIEDIIDHTNGECHVLCYSLQKEKIFLSILMPSVTCVNFSQFVDHCET